ncbi:MAG: GGDEF domain-containing protein [Burkholderiaceae bacterium]|nr:GGDEF domain-containing protein [Burkholderiaceae bacterium]
MQYPHSPERSTELLRQALPLMSRQSAALHPMSYALWYAYVAQPQSALRDDVDRHLTRSGRLDEATTAQLYQRHLAQQAQQAQQADNSGLGTVQQLAEGLQQLIGGISSQAALASDQTTHYGDALQRMAGELAQTTPASASAAAGAPPAVLDELLQHTRQMQSHMGQLQQRLVDSQREIEQLRNEVERARAESLVDALTGLANRRAFDSRLAQALHEASSGGTPPCLLVADLDHFKRINDHFGHGFGDQVLRATAQVLRSLVPAPALAARVGGEEFAVLLPAAALDEALALAERLRTAVAAARIRRKGHDEPLERVTLSLGAALWRSGESADSLVDRADRALYSAKASGRDRVALAEH